MNYWKIIPDKLVDWIEQQRNPERYYRIVILLLRISNWGNGTYKDGVKVKKGQKRITLRKLAQITGYSLDSVHRIIKNLQKSGWIDFYNRNNLTIITLTWITKPEHLKASNPNTQTPKPEHQPEHTEQSTTIATQSYPEHQPEHTNNETRTPKTAKPEIRNNNKNIETKEIEKKEENNKQSNKAPEKGDNVLDDSKKQINREIIRNVVEKIASEFKAKYKAKFNRYPIIDKASTKRIEEALANSATDFEELKDLSRHLIQKIPDYFKLRDKWVREKGYSWFAFSYRVGDLLSEPVKCQATNTSGVDFKLTLSRI